MKWSNLVSRVQTSTILCTLEVLHQSLEDKLVTLSRAQGSLIFPPYLQAASSPVLDFSIQP